MNAVEYFSKVFSRASEILEERGENVLAVALLDGISSGLLLAKKINQKTQNPFAEDSIEESAMEIVSQLNLEGGSNG